MAMTLRHAFVMLLALMLVLDERQADGAVSAEVQKLIHEAKLNGPYVGVVIPNLFELSPLLHNPNFTSANFTIPFSGRRFRFGAIGEKRVILVMTGLSLRYGDGPSDELTLESNGDYTRELGFLKFANFTTNVTASPSHDNLLNNVWYQPEEVFFIDGTPEQRQHAFWVPVDSKYLRIAKTLADLKLEGCLNSTTCLDEQPRVVTVQRGTSGSVFLDNAAYRSFIYSKFNVSPVDMESASVALICLLQRVPFIIIRALSDLAGGGSAESNEADIFTSLAANNAVTVVIEFIKQLSA